MDNEERAQMVSNAVMHQIRGRHEQALSLFDTVINADPERVDVHTHRGITLAALGRYQEAMADFNTAIEKIDISTADGQFDAAYAYYNRGKLFTEIGNPEQALDSLNRSLALRMDNYDALTARARAQVTLGDKDDAYMTLERAVQVNPDRADAYVMRGFMRKQDGHTLRARFDLDAGWERRSKADPSINWQSVADALGSLGFFGRKVSPDLRP